MGKKYSMVVVKLPAYLHLQKNKETWQFNKVVKIESHLNNSKFNLSYDNTCRITRKYSSSLQREKDATVGSFWFIYETLDFYQFMFLQQYVIHIHNARISQTDASKIGSSRTERTCW